MFEEDRKIDRKWSYCSCNGDRHNFIMVKGVYVCEDCKKPMQKAVPMVQLQHVGAYDTNGAQA